MAAKDSVVIKSSAHGLTLYLIVILLLSNWYGIFVKNLQCHAVFLEMQRWCYL